MRHTWIGETVRHASVTINFECIIAFVSAKAVNDVYQPGKPMRDAWLAGLSEWLSGLDESINGARNAKLNPSKD